MNKSESIKEISVALSKFQGEVANPKNSADNPFFKSKYAPLNEILNDVRPLLSKYGLSVLQMPSGDGDNLVITTLLMHSSGEWIESCPLKMKPAKNDPQGIGSAITYGRRYTLAAVLGISSEDDDDGNAATHGQKEPTKGKSAQKAPTPPQNEEPTQPKQTPAPNKITAQALTDKQLNRLYAIAKDIPKEVMANRLHEMGFASSKELTRTAYDQICTWAEHYSPMDEIPGVELDEDEWDKLRRESRPGA